MNVQTINSAIYNQVNVASRLVNVGSEMKTVTRLVIEAAIAENVKHADFIETVKTIYVNHVSWPVHNNKKIGENGARKSAAGKGFNSLRSTFAQFWTADESGMIREKTNAEKAPKKKAASVEDAPEVIEELPMAAEKVEFTAEQLAGMLLAKLDNDLKAATKVLKAVAAAN